MSLLSFSASFVGMSMYSLSTMVWIKLHCERVLFLKKWIRRGVGVFTQGDILLLTALYKNIFDSKKCFVRSFFSPRGGVAARDFTMFRAGVRKRVHGRNKVQWKARCR
jgi:hypothetical protein